MVFYDNWDVNEPVVLKAVIVKETNKQYKIDYGKNNLAFHCRRTISKDDSRFSLSAAGALTAYIENKTETIKSIEAGLAKRRKDVETARRLLAKEDGHG